MKEKIKYDPEAVKAFIANVKKDGVYEVQGVKKIIIKTPISEETKKLCQIFKRVAEIREASYDPEAANAATKAYENGGLMPNYSKFYGKDLAESAYEALVEADMDPNLWYLVYISLKNNWNDVLDWAENPKDE